MLKPYGNFRRIVWYNCDGCGVEWWNRQTAEGFMRLVEKPRYKGHRIETQWYLDWRRENPGLHELWRDAILRHNEAQRMAVTRPGETAAESSSAAQRRGRHSGQGSREVERPQTPPAEGKGKGKEIEGRETPQTESKETKPETSETPQPEEGRAKEPEETEEPEAPEKEDGKGKEPEPGPAQSEHPPSAEQVPEPEPGLAQGEVTMQIQTPEPEEEHQVPEDDPGLVRTEEDPDAEPVPEQEVLEQKPAPEEEQLLESDNSDGEPEPHSDESESESEGGIIMTPAESAARGAFLERVRDLI
ncbi:hypothetical protein DL771_002769 [Monosporascus sp. 5C6A]|nr:hypothetical protein DL771_002769 [Monosporascus sp. 5C6A]